MEKGLVVLGMMIIYQDFLDRKDAEGGHGIEIEDVSCCREGRGEEGCCQFACCCRVFLRNFKIYVPEL